MSGEGQVKAVPFRLISGQYQARDNREPQLCQSASEWTMWCRISNWFMPGIVRRDMTVWHECRTRHVLRGIWGLGCLVNIHFYPRVRQGKV